MIEPPIPGTSSIALTGPRGSDTDAVTDNNALIATPIATLIDHLHIDTLRATLPAATQGRGQRDSADLRLHSYVGWNPAPYRAHLADDRGDVPKNIILAARRGSSRAAAIAQAHRAASAAAAVVTAMDEGCDASAPEWHWCYPVQVQALVAAGAATATADTPFYEDQQMGAAGPESPRDRWSEAAWVLRRHWDRHLTEGALVNAPAGTAYTPAPDGQDKHRCAHYLQCREQGEIPLTAAISVRSNEGKITTRDHKEQSPAPKRGREKRSTSEEQNNDQDQRGGNTHRNKRDVHGRSPPRTWVA
jgi:hypothetical protein